jgi:hypothetical protein
MSSLAIGFKMDRRMNQRYRHRFIRRLRVWLQYGSRLNTSAPDDLTPWPSVHPTVAFKSYRDAPTQLLQHWMYRRLDRGLNSSSDGYTQIIQYRLECGVFSTGWSGMASVYSIVHCLGFSVQRLYWTLLVIGWSDALQGETIGSSDGTTFQGLFPMASHPC